MRIAVVDMGSTTLHLQHLDVLEQGALQCSFDEKRTLHLGDKVFAHGHLDAGTRVQVDDALAELLAHSRAQHPDRLAVVATSPFRVANNGPELARELGRRHGVEVRILSARREAQLSYLANASLPRLAFCRSAVVDLGGGSAEVAVGEDGRCMHVISLPVGALRMRRLIPDDQPIGLTAAGTLSGALRETLLPELTPVRDLGPSKLVFASGTARAVRALITRDTPDAGKVGPLCSRELQRGLARHLGLPARALRALGVDPARADSVLVAAIVMSVLAELAGVQDCWVSDRGLRDGVALELYQRSQADRAHPPVTFVE